MGIEYRDTHDFSKEELDKLFLSVEWSSGHFPNKLVITMKNFKTVYSAWVILRLDDKRIYIAGDPGDGKVFAGNEETRGFHFI